MFLIKEWRISTWMIGMLRPFVNSIPSAELLVCPRCGLTIDAQKKVGTSSFVFAIVCDLPKRSHCKHVVVLTLDGKLSISCESSRSEELQSHHGSGVVAGTFSSEKNSAKPCGCDPGAQHICEEHST